jgi:hypothetical protein
MRTTGDIPDPVYRPLKSRPAREGSSAAGDGAAMAILPAVSGG